MKRLLVSLFMFVAIPLFAQTTPTIGVIDVQRVVSDSEVGKKALAEIKTIKDKKQQDMDAREQTIEQMQDKLQKQKDILSADAQQKLNDDIQKAYTDLKRFREDSEAEIQNRLNTALKSMEDRVIPIIQKMGAEKGYSVILVKDQLVYYNAKNDITDDVIRLFNEQAAKGGAAPAPQTKP
jgi:outer membrane protein